MSLIVPDASFRKPSIQLNLSVIFKVFKNGNFRAAAFGYFGHMWELYAFWLFVPIILQYYNSLYDDAHLNVPFWSFVIIGVGGFSCVIGATIAEKVGTKKTAFIVEHDFIMAAYLADRVIVYEGQPSKDALAKTPETLLSGMNRFLKNLEITFRRDPTNYRPRINKKDSLKDREQKSMGSYYYLDDD